MIQYLRNLFRLWRLKRMITRDVWRSQSTQTEAEKLEALQKFHEDVFVYQIYRKYIKEQSK
jgi:hypothetical protein